MANYRAVASGNWNTASTWAGLAVPPNGQGHNVFSNTFFVTVDADINIALLTNALSSTTFDGGGTAAAGGGFLVTTTRNITATEIRSASTNVTLLSTTNISNTAITINASQITKNVATGAHTITHNGEGTINILNSNVNNTAPGVLNATINNINNGSIIFTNCTVGFIGSTGNVCHVVTNNCTRGYLEFNNCIIGGAGSTNNVAVANMVAGNGGIIRLIGCILNGGGPGTGTSFAVSNYDPNNRAAAVGSSGIVIADTCTINANKAVALGNGTPGSIQDTGGTIICRNCNFNASNTTHAVAFGGVTSTMSGNFNNAVNGTAAIYAPSYRIDPIPTNGYIRYARNGTGVGSDAWLYQFTTDSLSAFSMPPVSSVRFGTTFANNTLTGTCVIPSPSSVAFGVPTDNTTGQAVFSTNTFFDLPLSAINTPDTIGMRIKNAATIESAGYLLASFTTN